MRDSSYYHYRLVGILVHSGTTESGHYYSYIRERGPPHRWIHFDDSAVEEFLESVCFAAHVLLPQSAS